jgi:hypothetical protein
VLGTAAAGWLRGKGSDVKARPPRQLIAHQLPLFDISGWEA